MEREVYERALNSHISPKRLYEITLELTGDEEAARKAKNEELLRRVKSGGLNESDFV